MALTFSLRKFPASGQLKSQCGLPFGCVVQPLAQFEKLDDADKHPATVEEVARCHECYAYINKFCHFERLGWACSLCGNFNEYHNLVHNRYMRQAQRAQLPELQDNLVELKCSAKEYLRELDEGVDSDDHLTSIPDDVELVGRPVYIALVDTSGDSEYLECVKSSLLAALEALPPVAVFGIITFSDQVGLYDVRGQLPVVKFVPIVRSSSSGQSPTTVELGDALPLEDFLAPVGLLKERIHSALEVLEPDRASALEAHDASNSRGFGGAMQAVLRYLSGLASSERVGHVLSADEAASVYMRGSDKGRIQSMMIGYSGARVMCFLSGPPNYGPGSSKHPILSTSSQTATAMAGTSIPGPMVNFQGADAVSVDLNKMSMEDAEEAMPAEHNGKSEFYEDAAAAAAALGVSVDLFALSSTVLGLQTLEPLVSNSGGQMCWYPGLDGCTLPQDVYRHLAGMHGRSCRLRLRTSPEFHVKHSYGLLLSDHRYENLHHMVSCGVHDCIAFDFEFMTPNGFLEAEDCPPTLQLAFQYTCFDRPASDHTKGDTYKWYGLKRFIRIHTVQVAIARTSSDLYSYVDASATLALLMHKIVRAMHEEGVREARSLLQDWLVILTAHYNINTRGKNTEVDVNFENFSTLQPLARLVYVLLQSPLLGVHSAATQLRQTDLRCFLQNLWAKLPPADLHRAVYPVLSSWSSPDKPAFPKHSLSRTAIITSGEPIFLLDSFTHLIVYYVQGYPEDLPFPPPQASKLRQTINHLRNNRLIAPQIRMLRGGIDDVGLFTSCLIEEADSDAVQAGGEHIGTFVQFLDMIKSEAEDFLKAQHQNV